MFNYQAISQVVDSHEGLLYFQRTDIQFIIHQRCDFAILQSKILIICDFPDFIPLSE